MIIFLPDITSQNLYYLLTDRHREEKTQKCNGNMFTESDTVWPEQYSHLPSTPAGGDVKR